MNWRVVVTNGKDRTALWFGEAASKTEAEALALAERPGWFVQECDPDLQTTKGPALRRGRGALSWSGCE